MNLLKQCDPILLKVCELTLGSSSARYDQVREEFKELFDALHKQIDAQEGLRQKAGGYVTSQDGKPVLRPFPFPADCESNGAARVEQVTIGELALVHFVDEMLSQPTWPHYLNWASQRLAVYYNQLAGRSQFYQLLDDALERKGDSVELLGLFYICLGLGFQGNPDLRKEGRPKTKAAWMQRTEKRLGRLRNVPDNNPLCGAVYEKVDQRKLAPKTWKDRLTLSGIVSVALIIGVFVTCSVLYDAATDELRQSVRSIEQSFRP